MHVTISLLALCAITFQTHSGYSGVSSNSGTIEIVSAAVVPEGRPIIAHRLPWWVERKTSAPVPQGRKKRPVLRPGKHPGERRFEYLRKPPAFMASTLDDVLVVGVPRPAHARTSPARAGARFWPPPVGFPGRGEGRDDD